MRRRILSLLALATTAVALNPAAASAAPLPTQIDVNADVNFLFVGFDRKTFAGNESDPVDVDAIYENVFKDQILPQANDQVLRFHALLDEQGKYAGHPRTGLTLHYRHHLFFTGSKFENRFFGYLADKGLESPPTRWQDRYNAQDGVLDISEPILRIDGPAVEGWLLRQAKSLKGYKPDHSTVVFINWYGRADFRHHVYFGNGFDPDTGRDDRLNDYEVGSMWGSSRGRLWFYDLSAGPDGLNWDIEHPEFFDRFRVNADGEPDIRVPPVWEMGDGLAEYIVPDATIAAGILARTALYGIVHANPGYDPMVSFPKPGGTRFVRTNLFRENPDTPLEEFLHPGEVLAELRRVQPIAPTQLTLTDYPFAGEDRETYEIYSRGFGYQAAPDDCWNAYGYVSAQLYCHVYEDVETYAAAGPRDWAVPLMFYEVSDETARSIGRFHPLGISDSDPHGDPYQTFAQIFPGLRAWNGFAPGVGGTNLVSHEVGHHIGLAHPHDWYDSDDNADRSAGNNVWAWSMDGCQCTMGYFNTADFGEFEKDSLARSFSARAYQTARAMLPSLPKAERKRVVESLRETVDALKAGDYPKAARKAKAGYYRAWKSASPRARRRASAHPRWRPTEDRSTFSDPAPDSDIPWEWKSGPFYGVGKPGGPLLDAFVAASR